MTYKDIFCRKIFADGLLEQRKLNEIVDSDDEEVDDQSKTQRKVIISVWTIEAIMKTYRCLIKKKDRKNKGKGKQKRSDDSNDETKEDISGNGDRMDTAEDERNELETTQVCFPVVYVIVMLLSISHEA